MRREQVILYTLWAEAYPFGGLKPVFPTGACPEGQLWAEAYPFGGLKQFHYDGRVPVDDAMG